MSVGLLPACAAPEVFGGQVSVTTVLGRRSGQRTLNRRGGAFWPGAASGYSPSPLTDGAELRCPDDVRHRRPDPVVADGFYFDEQLGRSRSTIATAGIDKVPRRSGVRSTPAHCVQRRCRRRGPGRRRGSPTVTAVVEGRCAPRRRPAWRVDALVVSGFRRGQDIRSARGRAPAEDPSGESEAVIHHGDLNPAVLPALDLAPIGKAGAPL